VDVVLASAQSDLRFALEVFLREQPGVVVVGTATGTRGLTALIESICPDIVILDGGLLAQPWAGEPLAGVMAAGQTCERAPRIVVLGRYAFERQAVLDAGADAFVWRGDPPEALIIALRQLVPGRGARIDPIPTTAEGE
jgi:DNA-binding NarL/FixJ family response regulator